jgi:4-carboxymuconolactone decarboxylase
VNHPDGVMDRAAAGCEMSTSAVEDYYLTLRRLTIGDARYLEPLLTSEHRNVAASRLDAKTHALVRIGTLIALDPGPQSYSGAVEAARMAGASIDEIVGTLVAALPVVGLPRVSSAAPKLGLALGYDLEFDLEARR